MRQINGVSDLTLNDLVRVMVSVPTPQLVLNYDITKGHPVLEYKTIDKPELQHYAVQSISRDEIWLGSGSNKFVLSVSELEDLLDTNTAWLISREEYNSTSDWKEQQRLYLYSQKSTMQYFLHLLDS